MTYKFVIRSLFSIAGIIFFSAGCSLIGSNQPKERAPFIYGSSNQLIVVKTNGWNEYEGILERYERTHSHKNWKRIGKKIPVLIGKNGLGWAQGANGITWYGSSEGPVKKEGDGKSPAGMFRVGSAFGYASQEKAPAFLIPYLQIDKNTQCIEDTESAYYNQIIDGSKTQADWVSTDHMLRKDDLYEWGFFVEHNLNAMPGDGSCIFFHGWRLEGKGTAGCTSMSLENMLLILTWLDSTQKPAIVQLPREEYFSLQARSRSLLP